ncbi:calcium-binding protein [Phenylobacterium sp.]|uniref:calcium-binding protein n=1 Tax=Phenylobacterium sp. TaxID=1871053 RepID=UPI0035ADC401
MATYTLQGGVNIDALQVGSILGMNIDEATALRLALSLGVERVVLSGEGFTYDANQQITGGTITGLNWTMAGGRSVELAGASLPVPQMLQWFFTNNTQAALGAALSGDDQGIGSSGSDVLRGFAGADTLSGGAAFDDLNGNTGDDLVMGGDGDDWVLGGKDNDRLFGENGGDFVHGNLGLDTLTGGQGGDTMRGGQGDDRLDGGDGDDWLSGDRGSDVVVGGTGADVFHASGDAGLDTVTDFNALEGDRVQIDGGAQYAASQQGADIWIDISGGARLVLQNVQLATLPQSWIFTL